MYFLFLQKINRTIWLPVFLPLSGLDPHRFTLVQLKLFSHRLPYFLSFLLPIHSSYCRKIYPLKYPAYDVQFLLQSFQRPLLHPEQSVNSVSILELLHSDYNSFSIFFSLFPGFYCPLWPQCFSEEWTPLCIPKSLAMPSFLGWWFSLSPNRFSGILASHQSRFL